MSHLTLNLTPALRDYLLAVSLREPAILNELREATAALPMGNMQISPEQGQFMALLVELLQPKKLLEIGVFTGYSSLAVMLAAPADSCLIACDVRQDWTDIAQKYWQRAGVQHKIKLELAPALDTLAHLIEQGEANSFDFVFIDADKKNYPHYYEKALNLLRPGGLMLIDNVLQRGRVIETECEDAIVQVIRQFNQQLLADPRITLSMLPLGDGLTLVRKR